MKKKRDYQEPWTLPFRLKSKLSLLTGSLEVDFGGNDPASNMSVDGWGPSTYQPNQSLEDWSGMQGSSSSGNSVDSWSGSGTGGGTLDNWSGLQ